MNQSNLILNPNFVSHIKDNLWLGSHPSGADPTVKDYKYIMCFDGRPYYNIYEGQTVICMPFQDANYVPDENLLNSAAMMAYGFGQTGKTLLHCSAGINRSALVMGLCLVKFHGMHPGEAIKLMREKRAPMVLMNQYFEKWLRSLHKGPV